ncbi:MAG: hypothetical protein HRT68_16925 [Flavobacteriaceae bacterium]|nr:hypothetical protein [Flavobacteriaceae bacterium]
METSANGGVIGATAAAAAVEAVSGKGAAAAAAASRRREGEDEDENGGREDVEGKRKTKIKELIKFTSLL